jgi:hypothetical protein
MQLFDDLHKEAVFPPSGIYHSQEFSHQPTLVKDIIQETERVP